MLLVDDLVGGRRELGEARFAKPAITVRELIQARVELELEAASDALNEKLKLSRAAAAEHARGYTGSLEWRLNGADKTYRPRLFAPCADERVPDLDAVLRTAEEAFLANRFFLLLDERQAESLDEVIEIDRTGEAAFLLLTPLQGG